MIRKVSLLLVIGLLSATAVTFSQNLNGRPYTPGVDADIDMYISSWKDSAPRRTHGSLIEQDILTKGDPLKPSAKGATLIYINRFTHATLEPGSSSTPTALRGEQEILYILSGNGAITGGGKTHELYQGIAVLIPANLEFTLSNTGSDPLTLYLINEPIPEGFRPNTELLVRDENTTRVSGTTGHWVHIVKGLFNTSDGLGTLESVITVSFDPMTIGHPHSHEAGVEEAWTAISGTSIAFIGKQIRKQEPGTGYMIPPDGKTPHSNINISDEQVKMLYFARYRDHEVRE